MNPDNPVNIKQGDDSRDTQECGEEATTTTLQVHAYDWTIRDVYGDDDHVAVHCWSLDRNSKPHLLRFTDFPAFCHLELPIFVRGRVYTWRPAAVDAFMKLLSEGLGEDSPIRYTFKEAKKTYYYRGNRRFPMLQLSFNNLRSMQRCTRLLENPLKTDDWGFIKCNIWEDSISIVRKLLTVRDIRYSQWFSVTAHLVEPELRVSTLEREYIAEWDTMAMIPLEICKAWNTQPGVLAFDIECYSNNHRAMPDKYNALHVAYMISCIYQRYRDPTTRRRYGIIIGDCNHIPPEKLRDCEIIRVNSEYEMIEAFARIVQITDPEILTGYNILGFDYPYLDHRVKRWLKQWPSMGRIVGEAAHMTSKTWKSGAYGHQSINILQMEGRISIDLLPIVKRDYKLEKYDLNTVCKKFINKTKHDIKASDMFLIYEDIRDTLTTLVGILREQQNIPDLANNPEFIKRRDAAQEAFQHAKDETTRVMEYCIQDSELVIELMEKMNIWVGLVEMSNIVGTTIVELFTRGQQVRCLSQLYDLAARMGYILDKRDTPGFKFAGGFVYEPIPGLYENIICLDFTSLYPSIMMAYNICYTTLIPPELEDLIPDEDCHIIEFDQDELEGIGEEDEDEEEVLKELNEKTKKGKIVKKHYRFKFYKHQEGLLPRLVRQLVTERRAVNRQIVQLKDELKALEKTEDVRITLDAYLNGGIKIGDATKLAQHVQALAVANPPTNPNVLAAAVLELRIAQLFDVGVANKRLNELLEAAPPAHPDLITFARFGLTLAQNVNNLEVLTEYLRQLTVSQGERLARIEAVKLLIIVLDKRQLAIKVSANSFFGFLGVHNGGKMPLIEGAMSITAWGRQLIGTVRQNIERDYGGVQIYGDTDSVMMDLHIKDSKDCDYWGRHLAQNINGIQPGEKDVDGKLWPEGRPGWFRAPLAMEFEKAMRLLCIKKKKYVAYLIGKNGKFKTEDILDKYGNVVGSRLVTLKKGIVLARRDNCLTEDTLVTLSNGTSVTIKNLAKNNTGVYGWNGRGISSAKQTAFLPQGKKRCMKINVIDGRTITCTPEHRFLVKQQDDSIVWKEARNLSITTDKLVCGLEAPEDIIGTDEVGWELKIGNHIFNLSHGNRSRTLAFMRILGFINSDGSLSIRDDGRIDCTVPLGHMIDANAMLDDIELICGLRPAITERTTKLSSFYQVRIPNAISEFFINIPGQDIGRRSNQKSSWPEFLLEKNCPKSILREFCGGMFGGDGISPYLTKQSAKCDTHKIEQGILIGLSSRLENQDSLKVKMEVLCDILDRAGYSGCQLSDNVETYSVNKASNDDKDLRVMYRIKSPSNNKCGFLRSIGYRYCIHKQLRQTAAQSLWRFEETVKSDRRKLLILAKQIRDDNKMTYKKALIEAKDRIIKEQTILYPPAVQSVGDRMFYEFCHNGPVSDNTLRKFCTMPSTTGWLNDIGVFSWFDQNSYAMKRDTMDIPVLYLPLHSVVDGGYHEVYDISVETLESFVANGIVVHNCQFLRDTYTKILDLIMNRGGLDEAITILVDAIQDLLDGKVPHDKLTIIRELGANYKSESYFMKVFSDELKKAGKIVNPGDRLDFIIVEDPTATLLGHKMRLTEQYLEKLNTPNPERIDYNYYIEKALMNPINQLFEVGFKDVIAQMQHVSYRPTNRHKTIYLDRPVQIILKMRERGYDLKVFKDAVRFNYLKLKGEILANPLTLKVVDQGAPPIVPHVGIPQACISTMSPPATPQSVKGLSLNIMSTPQPQPQPPVLVKPPTTPTLVMPRVAFKAAVPTLPAQTINMANLPTIAPLKLNIMPVNTRVPATPIIGSVTAIPTVK